MANKTQSSVPHIFAVILSFATLLLIFIGGLVTTTDSGISVPDWPLSFGRVFPKMVEGIIFEHGHRMVATVIGLMTIGLAILLTIYDDRRVMKRLGWNALALVIMQGVLGGITVLMGLSAFVSILHATVGQLFLCVIVAIAVLTSASWRKDIPLRAEIEGRVPFHQFATALFLSIFIQLLLGATVRHTGHAIVFHISGAFVVGVLSFMTWRRAKLEKREGFLPPRVGTLIGLIFWGTVLQIVAGIFTYVLLAIDLGFLSKPAIEVTIITLHVTLGAFLMALSVIMMFWAYRTKPTHLPKGPSKLTDYFKLTKPGISLMAGLTALAGFIMASKGNINYPGLFHTTVGTLLASGGAAALNMLFEIDVDAKMNRTKNRPLPAGRLKPGEGLLLGALLSFSGVLYLGFFVNWMTAFFAGLTISLYLYIYTPLKKVSSICTIAGAAAGALPPIIGWTAATGSLGWPALGLFLILFFWQFPHFLSLAWIYKTDYNNAGLHVLPRWEQTPSQLTATRVGWIMIVSSGFLLLSSFLPNFLELSGVIYLMVALSAGGWLLLKSTLFLMQSSHHRARQLFLASIIYVPVLLLSMLFNIKA